MAAQRVLEPSRGETRLPVGPSESMLEAMAVLCSRLTERRASLGGRFERLDARAEASELRQTELEQRVSDVQARLGRLIRIRRSQRGSGRGERVAHLQREMEMLRQTTIGQRPPASASGRLASVPRTARQLSRDKVGLPRTARQLSRDQVGGVLLFIGWLVVLWVALWQLGLALGLA